MKTTYCNQCRCFLSVIEGYERNGKWLCEQCKEKIENLAEKAVNWWAEVIKNPKFDNGDSSIAGVFAKVLAESLAKNVTREQIGIFKKELKEILIDLLWEYNHVVIGVDYHPDQYLSQALEKAGIPEENAPWKTDMQIIVNQNKVLVAYGYRSPWEEI